MKRPKNINSIGIILLFLLLCATDSSPKTAAQGTQKTPSPYRECWQYRSASIQRQPAASDRSNIYFAESNGRVTAIGLQSGSRVWSAELGGESRSNLLIAGSSLFVVTGITSKGEGADSGSVLLRSLSIRSGITITTTPIGGNGSFVVGESDGHVIAVSEDGYLTAIDISTGKTAWALQFPSLKPAVSDFGEKQVSLSDGSGEVRLIDSATGRVATTFHTPFRITSIRWSGDSELLLGDERGNLARVDALKKENIWKFRSGGGISGIVEVGSDLVVTSLDNFVYRISGGSGGVIWKRRQRGRILDLPVVAKDLTVVLSLGEPTAALFEGQKGKPAGQIELADGGSFLQRPLLSDSALIFFTNTGVTSYRQEGCTAN